MNRNTDTAGQIEDIRTLISAGRGHHRRQPDVRYRPQPGHQGSDRQGHRRRRGRPGGHRAERLRPVERPGELRLPRRQVAVREARRHGQRRLHARHRRRPRGHRSRQGLRAGARRVPGHQGRQGDLHGLGARPSAPSRSRTSSRPASQFDGIWTSGIDIPIVEAFKSGERDLRADRRRGQQQVRGRTSIPSRRTASSARP